MVRRRVSAVSNHGDRTMNQILSFSRSRETLNGDPFSDHSGDHL
jgi:hypothetical protein